MAGKSAEHLLHEFRANASADVTMALLRSKDAMFHLALMAAHLGDGQVVDGQTLTAEMDADLPALLQGYFPAEGEAAAWSADADALLTRWTKKGWVHRGVDPQTRLERYQLTSGAMQAVRQVRNLQRQASMATESALTMVMAELRQIATDANPDPVARRNALEAQIAMLAAQLEALDAGDVPEVNHGGLVDRVATLGQLIERIPGDVAQYGEQMHANTAALLRQSLADDPAQFAESLQRMFDGHDVIAESPEGQAFRAFATVVATPSQRAQLESDIAEIISRVSGLPVHMAEVLSGFIDAMWQRVQEVEETRGSAFRRMGNFVRGGDIQHYRSMRTRISEAQASAALAFHATHPGRDTGFPVPVGGLDVASVGRLRLGQGSAVLPDPVTDSTGEFDIDPAALAGQESIDWNALQSAVRSAMEAHGGYATLPEVLSQLHQPRAGDIIGIWALAARYGDVDDTDHVMVAAHTSRGLREISVPYLVFGEEIPVAARPAGHAPQLTLHFPITEGIANA
jgi:hypothetical protein